MQQMIRMHVLHVRLANICKEEIVWHAALHVQLVQVIQTRAYHVLLDLRYMEVLVIQVQNALTIALNAKCLMMLIIVLLV